MKTQGVMAAVLSAALLSNGVLLIAQKTITGTITVNNSCSSYKSDSIEIQTWLSDDRGQQSGGQAQVNMQSNGQGQSSGTFSIQVPWGPGLGEPKEWSFGKAKDPTSSDPDRSICAQFTCKDRSCPCANTNTQPPNVPYQAGKGGMNLVINCACIVSATVPVDYWSDPKNPPVYPKPVETAMNYSSTLVGVVLAADTRGGETSSASVVTDPQSYANIPGLAESTTTLPLAQNDKGEATLSGVVVDTGDGKHQSAEKPILLTAVAGGAAALGLTFLRESDSSAIGQQSVPLPAGNATGTAETTVTRETATAADYQTSPVYVAGRVQAIHGPLGGNANKTSITVDGTPGTIVAETLRGIYWNLPENIAPGAHYVVLSENGKPLTGFNVWVVDVRLAAPTLQLTEGQTIEVQATVSGAGGVPASAWQAGYDSSLINAASLKQIAPGAALPVAGSKGAIVLQIANDSKDAVTLQGSKDERITQSLSESNFAAGDYTLVCKITGKRGGAFNIHAVVLPMLAPIPGQAVQLN
jgi:hypothetical protein